MRKIFIYLAPLTEQGYYLLFFSREWSLKELLCFDSLPLFYAKPRVGEWQHTPALLTSWMWASTDQNTRYIRQSMIPSAGKQTDFRVVIVSPLFLPEACCWEHIYEIFNEYVLWNASGRKFSHACLANNYLPFLRTTQAGII